MAPNRAPPGATDRDIAFQGLPENPEDLLHETLFPEDAYKGTTYWADLPRGERAKWVRKQHSEEAKREWGIVWRIFKDDPLRPLSLYFRNYAVTGLGFFVEGYTLFSVGNLKNLFQTVWPQCFKAHTACSEVWVDSINYLEIVGIIFGQVIVGIIGDWVGRRWGIIQDAVIMWIGSILLTAMIGGSNLQGWVIMYALSLLIFGVGVGGEYPMTSTTAMEGVHGKTTSKNDKLHRGRGVLLAFLMQGWGQVINQVVLILCLLVFHSGATPPFTPKSAEPTFRVSFAFIVVFLALLVYIRVFKLRNVDAAVKASRKKSNVTGYDITSLKLAWRHYYGRLIVTSVAWFCNDVSFYGGAIFRDVFLQLVTSNSEQVITLWLYNLINVGCALVGYHVAALFIDHKAYGRKRMQMFGFLFTGILFLIAAVAFPQLNTKGVGGKLFQFIYFFSSFWTQFGPNSTTFLIAAEVYPASIRASAHGFSAAVGKLGALGATVLYNYIDSRTKFWVAFSTALVGLVLTVIFVPDTTGLDLREQERYWDYVREGRESEYHGIAINKRHLSLFERVVLKREKAYDPAADRDSKIAEMRELYDKVTAKSAEEEDTDSLDDLMSEKASTFFDWEKHNRRESKGTTNAENEKLDSSS